MTFQEIQDLLRQDPGRWPLPARLGAIAAFFVVISAAMIWFGVWTQKKDELAQYQNEEQTLRQEFRTKHAKAVNLELYTQQLEEIRKSFGTMLQQLPGRTEMEALLTDISQTGSAAGLQLELFKKLPEETKDFYAMMPIQIRFKGSYHQMGEFVSGVAALPRIVTLHNMTIKTTSDKGGADQLLMEVTARTYRYLDEGELAAAEAAKKQTTTRGSSSS